MIAIERNKKMNSETKTPEQIIKWCDLMLSLHPNAEDKNFFIAIKGHMEDTTK